MFQHTAARRRLRLVCWPLPPVSVVSTHSRAEAAAGVIHLIEDNGTEFQHTATRRWLPVFSPCGANP